VFISGIKIGLGFMIGDGSSTSSQTGDKSYIVMHNVKLFHFTVLEDDKKADLPSKMMKAFI